MVLSAVALLVDIEHHTTCPHSHSLAARHNALAGIDSRAAVAAAAAAYFVPAHSHYRNPGQCRADSVGCSHRFEAVPVSSWFDRIALGAGRRVCLRSRYTGYSHAIQALGEAVGEPGRVCAEAHRPSSGRRPCCAGVQWSKPMGTMPCSQRRLVDRKVW